MAPPTRGTASAAFFSRFWNTCSSWSGSPAVGGSDGSKSSVKRACAAKPACAARRARSSTSWMLSGRRCAGRRSPNCLDPVDELADPRRLGLDQAGQLAVGVAEAHLEQLRRAGDAGERVPDLVREHRRHAGDRARRRAVAEAAVHLLGHALRVHQDQDLARRRRAAARRGRSAAAAAGRAQPTMTSYWATETPLRRAWPHHVEHRAVVADEARRAAGPPSAGARSRRSSRSPGWR